MHQLDLNILNGPALVVEVPDNTNITGAPFCTCLLSLEFAVAVSAGNTPKLRGFVLCAAAAALDALKIPPGTVRVLFKTLNSKRWAPLGLFWHKE